MNNKLVGIIDATTTLPGLNDFTLNRPACAIPYLGRYRLIDFTLTNYVNSGIKTVGVFPTGSHRSLRDHLSNGKPWNLDRKSGGLFMLSSYEFDVENESFLSYKRLEDHIEFINYDKDCYFVIARANVVSRIDLQDALEHHINSKKDITCIANNGECIGTYIIHGSKLLGLIEKRTYGNLETSIDKDYEVTTNEYSIDGYVRVINTAEDFYKSSMDFINCELFEDFFGDKNFPIITKLHDNGPSKYVGNVSVHQSIIANGCIVEGDVEDSIIHRKTKIGRNTVIKNSIIMGNCKIGDNCVIENAILDKNVEISRGTTLYNPDGSLKIIHKVKR